MKPTWLLLLSVATATAAHAATDDASLIAEAKKCAGIEGAGLRMTCYDAVFKGDGKAALPEQPTESPIKDEGEVVDLQNEVAPGGRWSVQRSKSAMTDQESIILSLESNEEVQCQQFGPPSTIYLVARCMENTTSLYMTGECHVASGFYGYGKVAIRLDDGKPFNRNMDASTDSQALGLWSGGEAIPLLKQMLGKKRMIARFTPFGGNQVEPTFDIAELDAVITPLREACGW